MTALALVTGASGGLGAAIARALAADGYGLVLTHRGGAERTVALTNELAGRGAPHVETLQVDLAEAASVEAAAERLAAHEMPVRAIVNSGGDVLRAPLGALTAEGIAESLAVHVTAPLLLARGLAPRMVAAGGGAIVNVASVLARSGAPDRAAYCAAKGGMVGLTTALAVELAPHVRVNALTLGMFDTPMNAAVTADAAVLGQITERIPLGRLGHAAECAEIVRLLCSPAGGYVTGAVWAVDGGLLARLPVPSADRREADA